MRNKIIIIIFTLVLLVVAGTVVRCMTIPPPELEGNNVVFMIPVRDQAPVFDQIDTVGAYIRNSFQATGEAYNASSNLAFITLEGSPRKIPLDLSIEANNEVVQTREIRNIAEGNIVSAFLQSEVLRAQTEEVDMIAAWRLAHSTLQNMTGAGDNFIIIFDPGLSSSGALNFRNVDIFSDDAHITIPQRLKELDVLPRFDDFEGGVTIHFKTLGSFPTVPAQNWSKDQLVSVWRSITESAGARFEHTARWEKGASSDIWVHYSDEVPADVPRPAWNPPPVMSMAWPEAPRLADEMPNVPGPFSSTILRHGELGFLPNSAMLRDELYADMVLTQMASKIAVYLSEHPERTIFIAGQTSRVSRTSHNPVNLCKARAETIRTRLLELLGPHHRHLETRIVTFGLTSKQVSWRLGYEWNPDGSWNEISAAKNRTAIIFSSADFEKVAEMEAALERIANR